MKPYVVGAIFARGGSKGVSRKNTYPLAGKPLIAHAIEAALASEWIDRVIVSTDDAEIADVARQYGAEVPFIRPPELARDDSPEWLAWQHAVRTLKTAEGEPEMNVFVSIPPTSPLRVVEDVDACIKTLVKSDADLVFTVTPAEGNPYFNMVVLDEAGYARLMIPPDRTIYRRQDAPPVYNIVTVAYAARPQFVLNANSMFEGKIKAVIVPKERALDIDTKLDFKFAEFMMGYSKDVTALFAFPQASLHDVLICLETTKRGIVLVVDDDRHLLGVITEGDVRRAILAGFDLTVLAQELLNRKTRPAKPITAPVAMPRNELISLMRKTRVSHIPILNETGQVVGLVGLDDLLPEIIAPPSNKLVV